MKLKEYKLKRDELKPLFGKATPVPEQVYYMGKDPAKLAAHKTVGIVGSRLASPYGRAVTEKLATELARAGVVIVSGLALGIDSIAHKAAVESKTGTIAVLPAGLDAIYPRSHAGLAKQIIDTGGTLVTEYPHGTEPQRYNFIARNRLIAALSDVLVIPEAAEKSGSLHTARFALEQGIDVMAVPGPITSQTSQGTNNLIKAGAAPVTSVEDILSALGLETNSQQALFADTEEETTILKLISQGVSDGHQLQQKSKLSPATYSQTLTMLELNGRIKPLGNNHWTLT